MATSSKRSAGIGIVGAVLAITGLVLLSAGQGAGIVIFVVGVALIAAGVRAARKTAPQVTARELSRR